MGALIGDALGLGPHWYYDLDELRRDYGEWITDYTEPKPGRYHSGMKAGQLSQSGLIIRLLMESVLENNGDYVETAFTHTLDQRLLPLLDGTASVGPGGYTSQSIRDLYERRVKLQMPWGDVAGNVDDTEALERCIVLAARYARNPGNVAWIVSSNCMLTQSDEAVVAITTAFNCVLALLIQGHPLDGKISGRLMDLVKEGELPFHAVTVKAPEGSKPLFSSPDSLLTASFVARAATDPDIRIDPAWKVSLVYGMPCAIYHQVPAAYYLAARFPHDFETAILQAINGGGQNMARAVLTGALVGAQVGLSGIPERFIRGLEHSDDIVKEVLRLGLLAEQSETTTIRSHSQQEKEKG